MIRRGLLKYVARAPALIYRGEFEIIRRVLLRRDPDLMHVYFGNTGVHLLPLIERWDRPCVVSFHGMDVQRRETERGYEANLRKLLRLVPLVLVRSRSIAQRLIELDCDPEKIRLNRTGIPLEGFPFLARRAPADGAWTMVQACRLVPKKGLSTALRAFARFAKAFPKSRFLIAGEGPLRQELEELVAQQLNLRRRSIFLDFSVKANCAIFTKKRTFSCIRASCRPTPIRKGSRIRCSKRWPADCRGGHPARRDT